MRTPIVLAKFSVRVIKAGRADPRAEKTNRSANDITASNAADSSVSMISSVEFLTRGGGKQRADNRPASKIIILEQGPERIAVNQKMARRKATYLSLDQTFDLTQSENWPICYEVAMATVDELWQMATDLYARGQSSNDPSMKQLLMRAAYGYLKQAEETRRGRTVIQAEFPKLDRKIG